MKARISGTSAGVAGRMVRLGSVMHYFLEVFDGADGLAASHVSKGIVKAKSSCLWSAE